MTPAARAGVGVAAGVVASTLLALVVGAVSAAPRVALVPEDASGRLSRIAIHYTPAMDDRALPVWRQLFAALPKDVEVEVAVPAKRDFDRFVAEVGAGNFHPVIVGHQITTWSRDRMAALANDSVLAPPRVATGSAERVGDWAVPFAIARDVYGNKPRIADLVFEGGDLAASTHRVFADVNLVTHNLGRGDASRAHLESVLDHTFSQDIVWLGDSVGDVPEHHIMMYMVPLDDTHALVGDVRTGLGATVPHSDDVAGDTARFDRVAHELEAKGIVVTRIPVTVLPGAGSYVTYTNAVFDRDAHGAVVYLPTYRQPALDAEATRIYEALGYRVVPIDVSTIYTLNGSLGCLVNVMARSEVK